MLKEYRQNVKNTEIIFNNQRAVYLPQYASLVISDLHLGKTTHFRQHGIPIPTDIAHQDLKRLENLIKHYQPKQILIAGDFFHADANSELDLFTTWRRGFPKVDFILIKGNHDRLANGRYEDIGIQTFKDFSYDNGISINHFPVDANDQFQICGHIHPGVSIRAKGRQWMRLPCFALYPHQLILPAFSLFTGLDTKSCDDDCRKIIFTNEDIFEL